MLDVGCGTGGSALPAAELVGPGGSVVGVDLAGKLLEIARTKAATRRLGNAEFRLGDMTNLGYPDGHFDAVISVFSVHFVPDMSAMVRELWRMAKPGGQLAITTWGPRVFEPAASALKDIIRTIRPDLYSASNAWDRITSPEQVRMLLQRGGVPNAEVVMESGNQVLRSPEDWWTIVLGSGMRSVVDAMGVETAKHVHDRNIGWLRDNGVASIETNVIYAIATKEKTQSAHVIE